MKNYKDLKENKHYLVRALLNTIVHIVVLKQTDKCTQVQYDNGHTVWFQHYEEIEVFEELSEANTKKFEMQKTCGGELVLKDTNVHGEGDDLYECSMCKAHYIKRIIHSDTRCTNKK